MNMNKVMPLTWHTCPEHGDENPNVYGCAPCLRELREENARLRRAIESAAPIPCAWVPVHPRTGRLWANVIAVDNTEERSTHYVWEPLYDQAGIAILLVRLPKEET